ncbi:hypothetical protein ACR42D_10125 [Desulfovibrio caledoniensis]
MLFDEKQLGPSRVIAFKDRPKFDEICDQIAKLMPGATVSRLTMQRFTSSPSIDEPLAPLETYSTNKNTYVVKVDGVEVFRAPSQKGLLRLVLKQAEKWIKETDFITLDEEREAIDLAI